MPTSQGSLISGMGLAMRRLYHQQQVIGQNVANADTPGYKARDLAPASFAGMVQDGMTGVTRPTVELSAAMVRLGARPPRSGGVILDHDVTETKPDGNNVTLEEQLLKLGNVQADFAALSNLYRKQMELLKTALGRNGSA